MKKIKLQSLLVLIFLISFIGFQGCKEDDTSAGTTPAVSVSPEVLEFGSDASVLPLKIESNREWTAAFVGTAPDWVTLGKAAGLAGTEQIDVTVMENSGLERSVLLKVVASTASVTLKITQAGKSGGAVLGEPIYSENVGTKVYKIDPVTGLEGGSWPKIDEYTKFFSPNWTKGGTMNQSLIEYSGVSSNVSNSGPLFDPLEGSSYSGAPYVGMNTKACQFLINKINIEGKSNLTLAFGAIFQADYSGGVVLGAVEPNSFTLKASIDGKMWANMSYTTALEDGGHWYKVISEFKVPEGSENLYIQIASPNIIPDQGYRFDDFKLYEGGEGELLDFNDDGKNDNTIPKGAIFYEDFGAEAATQNPDRTYPTIAEFLDKLTKAGSGVADVTYVGANTTVRPSFASTGYEGASGINGCFFGTVPASLQINKIALGDAKKLTLSFGISHAYSSSLGEVLTEDILVQVSKDGNLWFPLKYTISGSDWVRVNIEFAVATSISELYIKFVVPSSSSAIRVDDITLMPGGNGEIIDLDKQPEVALKALSDVRAHYVSGALLPENGWRIEGVVVSDKDGKNLQPYQFVMVDKNEANSGILISYVQGETNPDFNVGDKVSIDLTGTTYAPYKGLLQIGGVKTASVKKINSGNSVVPLAITVNQLKSGSYESMLVSIENVELVDKSVDKMNGNVKVKSGTEEFVMRTAATAVFKNNTTPKGIGRLVGISGVFDKDFQVLPRQESDYAGMQISRR